MGKLIVFKLITSWTDDIFVNGPYTDLPRERCWSYADLLDHGKRPKWWKRWLIKQGILGIQKTSSYHPVMSFDFVWKISICSPFSLVCKVILKIWPFIVTINITPTTATTIIVITTIINILILSPLCVSEGDCLDMMILVVLNENPKDCVASKSCVDQEVALEIKTPIDYNRKRRRWGKTWVAQPSPCQQQ